MKKISVKLKNKEFLISLPLLFLPFFLVSGPFLSDLTVSIYAIGFLIYIILVFWWNGFVITIHTLFYQSCLCISCYISRRIEDNWSLKENLQKMHMI